ncbi:MFS general substrate transporter [Rickenella mellea]|uniref:MFS general substrate transporter n=1 Tax=Rickenella mellea TaxID=50990 RepID=A0A4Y7PQU8_9AGAM|nr:MFS general substrate transporter [Rickenella mellea]
MSSENEPLLDHRGSNGKQVTYGRDLEPPESSIASISESQEAVEAQATSPGPPVRMLRIIFPLAIGIFLAAMDGTIVASSYATIGSELKQLQSTSWIATGYMVTLTSFQPLYGKLSDIFGRKACILFAYTGFGIGCLLCGLARTMNELIAARALAGLGGAGMNTVVVILVSDLVPLRERGTWQGVLNIIFAFGSAAGAPLGGIIADGVGWRWTFLIQVPIAAFAIIAVSLALHVPTKKSSSFTEKLKRVDFAGSFLLVFAILSLLIGLDQTTSSFIAASPTLSTILAPRTMLPLSFTLFAFFIFTETKLSPEPLAPPRIILSIPLLGAYFANLFGFGAGLALIYQFPLYVQAVRAKSASAAGMLLIPATIGGVIGSLSGGIVMQRTGKYWWLTVGAYSVVVLGASAVTVAAIKGMDLGFISAGLPILTIGQGSAVTTTLIALIANAAPEDQAIATAVSYLFRSLGSVIGISASSSIVQSTLRASLRRRLEGHDIDEIIRQVRASLSAIDLLDAPTRVAVRAAYSDAVCSAFGFAVLLACGAVLSSLFVREKALAR